MNPNIAVIVDRMKNGDYRQRDEYVSVQMADLAEVMALVAEDQTESAKKMEKQTTQLVSLTRWIVVLTFALGFLTAYLCYDVFQKSRSCNTAENQAQPHVNDQSKSSH